MKWLWYALGIYCSSLAVNLQGYRVMILNNNRHHITQEIVTPSSTVSRTLVPLSHIQPQETAFEVIQKEVPTQDSPDKTVAIVNNNNQSISQTATVPTIVEPSIAAPQLSDLPIMQKQSGFVTRIMQFLTSRNTLFIGGSLALGYVITLAKLFYDAYAIHQCETWSSWKGSIPLERLQETEQEAAKELFHAIEKRYAQAPLTACFLSPLVHFINDIDAEISYLNRFIQMHTIIDRFRLSILFPEQKPTLESAAIKLKRLDYLKHLVVQWVGEYSVEAHKR